AEDTVSDPRCTPSGSAVVFAVTTTVPAPLPLEGLTVNQPESPLGTATDQLSVPPPTLVMLMLWLTTGLPFGAVKVISLVDNCSTGGTTFERLICAVRGFAPTTDEKYRNLADPSVFTWNGTLV